MTTNYDKYMEKKPSVCGGALVVKGTRVRVKVVLDSLAEGHSPEEIVASYPTLTLEAVRAVVAYAAASAADDEVYPLPHALTA
jgi:uncharacterized protein (DUF433 family)